MQLCRKGEWRLFGLSLPRIGFGQQAQDRPVSKFVTVLGAIYRGQSMGKAPTLRDLHKITPYNQQTVLQLVRLLELEKLVEIDLKVHDRLASPIRLTKTALEEFGASLPE